MFQTIVYVVEKVFYRKLLQLFAIPRYLYWSIFTLLGLVLFFSLPSCYHGTQDIETYVENKLRDYVKTELTVSNLLGFPSLKITLPGDFFPFSAGDVG